jgi:hypothetical protein
MNDRMFDIYRQATESWLKVQQEMFDGLYKSTILLFRETSQVPEAKSSEGHPRIAGTNGSKATKASRKPSSGTSRRLQKVAGRRPERPGTRP